MKVLTIQRSKWQRGKGGSNTSLRNSDGKMCCLGFDALACGWTAAQLRGYGDPADLVRSTNAADVPLGYVTGRLEGLGLSQAVDEAIDHNDSRLLTDAEREEVIRADLKRLGWDDVRFVD